MPNYTKILKLEKPLQTEAYNVDKRNANWDKIDKAIEKDRNDAAAHNIDPGAHATGIAGNAGSATKLKTKQTIKLDGAIAGSVKFDGSAAATINTTIADNSVTASKLVDSSVTNDKLANESVTFSKLAPSSVYESRIADGSVTKAKLADNAVVTRTIADNSVTASKLVDSGVTAGTYTKVTVDRTGRVISASNPNTIAGLGINDAYTIAEVDNKFLLKNTPGNNSLVALSVGDTWKHGGYLELSGTEHNLKGRFILGAGNGSISHILRGAEDGTLTWNNNHLLRSIDGVLANSNGNINIADVSKSGSTGYIKYNNGLLICYGYVASISAGTVCNFAYPFSGVNYSLTMSHWNSQDNNAIYIVQAAMMKSTGFTPQVFLAASNGYFNRSYSSTSDMHYIAIGWWN